MHQFTSLSIAIISLVSLCFDTAIAKPLVPMTDAELSSINGQTLMSLNYIAPIDSSNPMKNIIDASSSINGKNTIGFYKLGLDVDLELNANIHNLQLGCGGINGANACDIDIKNLAISGLPTSYDTNGNPVYDNGRASTSATLSNPFMEFAIKDPDSASTREVKGVRFSAEKINALLTVGTENNAIPTSNDGIQSLSGFLRFSPTSGSVSTTTGLFGKGSDQVLQGKLNALGYDRDWTSEPGSSDTSGISIPSVVAGFTVPSFQVNGQRKTTAKIENVIASVDIPLDQGPQNQLKVNFDCILLIACQAKIALKEGSKIEDLPLNVTFEQSLSMIHNIPLTGTGGYLALQGMNLLWPGSYIDESDAGKISLDSMSKSDVAKTGWWMSFANAIDLGVLQGQQSVDVSAVYPQVAQKASDFLKQESQRVKAPAGAAIGTLFGITMTTPNPIIIDLSNAMPASLNLSNVQLKNQVPVSNCYGSLKFC